MPPPPTPAEVYTHYGEVDVSERLEAVIRVLVSGPAPLNTLATFTLNIGTIGYDQVPFGRGAAPYITGLVINGYDPGRPENVGLTQSCAASIVHLGIDRTATFTAAADAVGIADPQGGSPVVVKGWDVDDQGRFKLMLYQAQGVSTPPHLPLGQRPLATMTWWMKLRCWVLFHEPTPPPPETAEELGMCSAAMFASQRIDAYLQYVTLPDADLWKASQEMADLARPLEAARWLDEAITVRQLIVATLRNYTPPADQLVEYLIYFSEQRQNLIARLVEQNRLAEAAALGPETVAGYTDYYNGVPDADRSETVRGRLDPDLVGLQRLLADAGLTAEPVAALQLLVAGFRASTPPTDTAQRLDFDFKFAEARQDLIARLIDDGQTAQAQALVAETIDAYRQYASDQGADPTLAVGDLTGLAQLLAAARLTAETAAAQQAANNLRPS